MSAEEGSEAHAESTPECESQKPAEEASTVEVESKDESAEEFAETNEGKSHGAAAGE
jgi:hypothetical protein